MSFQSARGKSKQNLISCPLIEVGRGGCWALICFLEGKASLSLVVRGGRALRSGEGEPKSKQEIAVVH